MQGTIEPSEFLVISRGKWDESLPPERIQTAIHDFFAWLERPVAEGKKKRASAFAVIKETAR